MGHKCIRKRIKNDGSNRALLVRIAAVVKSLELIKNVLPSAEVSLQPAIDFLKSPEILALKRSYGQPYKTWMSMKDRCLNKNHMHFFRYGGSGITICDRWMVYNNFLADMGVPGPKMSLDRIDNNGNYEPGNCRWSTPIEQATNRKSTRFIEINGEIKSISAWCRIYKIHTATVHSRMRKGMSAPEAIITPSGGVNL